MGRERDLEAIDLHQAAGVGPRVKQRRGACGGGGGEACGEARAWLPKKLRLTRTSSPPMSAWPPSFWPAERARATRRADRRRRAGALGAGSPQERTFGGVSKEDEPSTRAPDRPPALCEVPERRDLRVRGQWARIRCKRRRRSPGVAKGSSDVGTAGRRRAAWPLTRPQRSATFAMVVLSPPGMIKPLIPARCSAFLTCSDGTGSRRV